MSTFVVPLADPSAELALVGGKGSSLAKLASAGLPVPPGFHVTTEAYNAFVERNGLQPRILDAVRDEPALASKVILGFFQECGMPEVIATPVCEAYAQLGGAVAVRSSATAEDLPDASFAGQQDTYLDVRGHAEVLDAVQRCWASLWTTRAIEYRSRHGIPAGEVSLAVVVQRMVPADVAGVLFTADPVSGAADRFVVNAVQGLGEALVSGQADPHVIVVDRASRRITEQRGRPAMDEEGVRELARLGAQIENLYRRPMDIEWARHGREIFIVQARPITVAAYEDWNSSLAGDYLWTRANLGEAIPSVMTPATWSLVQVFMSEAMSLPSLGPHRISGNIGGRFYLNLSLAMAAGSALGLGGLARRASEQAFGQLPQDMELPPLPMSRWKVLVELVPTAAAFLRRIRSYQKNLPALIAAASGRCAAIRATIERTKAARELADLWRSDVEPLLRDTSRMLAAGARLDGAGLVRIRPWLIKRVGEGDALLSGLNTNGPLASLGPVVGLDQLARGEIDHDEFVRQWGHRCPDEFEVSMPRPAEDPAWIDRDLAGIRQAPVDVRALLARQEQARAAALERFRTKYPAEVNRLQKRIAGAARAARPRGGTVRGDPRLLGTAELHPARRCAHWRGR